ncbi:hypothetical protein FALBO_2084 [Fusarium albosuccineum]|uniref:DUF7703 domain-containing protein n=1 Tax=Fusarium albosuccineum TaxID=1237068 RepID=A0A8H4LMP4_9HYPO|nr:hypothetical protein FALBO_2084 [Fusarium albosuccineum]
MSSLLDTTKLAISGAVYTPEAVLVIVCSTLALCNAFELLSLIFMTFKRRSGLYFWSILLALFGVIPYCVGWMIVYFDFTHDYVGMIIDSVGWVLILRGVLCMIIINGVVWHTTMTVLLFGSTYSPNESKRGFNAVFNVLERVQMTCFCLQEFIISGLYIWKTIGILKTAFGNTRRVLWQLFAINIVIVIMDIALLAIEYKNYFIWEQGVKMVTYSIKLKLEFAVLGELIDFIRHRGGTQSNSNRDYRNTGAFVELSVHRPGKGDKKNSSNKTDAERRRDLEANTVIVTTKTSPLDEAACDEIRVVTRMDVESL